MKICDIPPFEWFTDCDGGGSSLVGSVVEPGGEDVTPGPVMPEPGAGLLFGGAVIALVVMRKLGR